MTTITPPTPVGSTGTWAIRATEVNLWNDEHYLTDDVARPYDGHANNWRILNLIHTGVARQQTATWVFPNDASTPTPLVHLNGADVATHLDDLPLGFTPDDAYVVFHGVNFDDGGDGLSWARIIITALGLNELLANGAGLDPPFAIAKTGMTRPVMESLSGWPVSIEAHVDSGNIKSFVVNVQGAPFEVRGTYAAPLWWWRVLPVDACGHPQEAPFLYTSVDPGPPWVRLDPADVTAHPTPVVFGVTPNHGGLVAGTPCTIAGRGFGVGASVTFDGVPATDVVAVTETRLTCLAPAHAAGVVTVVVTNPDGVVST
jgi:hypothetical protein